MNKRKLLINAKKNQRGFTLIEMVLVVMIIGIAAACVVPMFTSAASFQVKSAADMIAADLEYVKSLSISKQQPYSVVFDNSNESYEIRDPNGNVITNPVTQKPYEFNFTQDSRVNSVDINVADFDGSSAVTFDDLGSPYSGTDLSSPLNSGTVDITAGEYQTTVKVEAVTGYISIID